MTQSERIERHLRDYGSITPMEAIQDYGILRLSARIYDLKHKGLNIKTSTVSTKNRYGERTCYAKYTLSV